MIYSYDLPTSINIGGEDFRIRYGWRPVMDILAAMNDPDLDDWEKATCMLEILYPDWQNIPQDCLEEAMQKACDFIDCNQKPDNGKPKPKMIDWEQDAELIIPEINKVAGREVRLDPNIHWWTFFGWFMGIGDGLFAEVLNIRQKKSKGKKLEKYEQDFYRDNKSMIDLKKPESAEQKEEKANIMKYL